MTPPSCCSWVRVNKLLLMSTWPAGSGLPHHGAVELSNLLIQALDPKIAAKRAEVAAWQEITQSAIGTDTAIAGAIARDVSLENPTPSPAHRENHIQWQRAIEV